MALSRRRLPFRESATIMRGIRDQIFHRMSKQRPERLNISIEEAARVDNEKPLSLIAAEERGPARGNDADVVLQIG